MNLEIITMLGKTVDHEVYEVMLPTADGRITVFPGHEPLVSIAIHGVVAVRYKKDDPDGKLDFFTISDGVIWVSQRHVKVLVDNADKAGDFKGSADA